MSALVNVMRGCNALRQCQAGARQIKVLMGVVSAVVFDNMVAVAPMPVRVTLLVMVAARGLILVVGRWVLTFCCVMFARMGVLMRHQQVWRRVHRAVAVQAR